MKINDKYFYRFDNDGRAEIFHMNGHSLTEEQMKYDETFINVYPVEIGRDDEGREYEGVTLAVEDAEKTDIEKEFPEA